MADPVSAVASSLGPWASVVAVEVANVVVDVGADVGADFDVGAGLEAKSFAWEAEGLAARKSCVAGSEGSGHVAFAAAAWLAFVGLDQHSLAADEESTGCLAETVAACR